MCRFLPSDLEDDQADLVNGDAADQITDAEEVIKKPKKKKWVFQQSDVCFWTRTEKRILFSSCPALIFTIKHFYISAFVL